MIHSPGPFPVPSRSWLIVCLLCVGVVANASRQGDSLRTDVDGMSSSAERARALLVIAGTQANSQPGESLVKVATAIAFAEKSGDRQLLLRGIRQQRELERAAGAYDQFLLSAIRAVELSEKTNDHRALADDIRCLCEAYERTGAFDKAVELRQQALLILRSTGDSAAIGKGIVELMNTLVLAGRFNEVLRHGDEALAYYAAHTDSVGQASVWMGQGEALIAQGRPADALPSLARAERVFRELRMDTHLGRTLRDIAEANVAMGRWQDARIRLDEVRFMATEHGTLNADPMLFALLSRMHEGLGETAEALVCLRRHTALKDSLFNERMAERMMGLQALYSANAKERAYVQLQERNTANEDLVASARTHARWWFAGSAVLLIGASFLYFMVRRIRRMAHRTSLKNQVILRQTNEIKAKNMELERQNLRLAEALINEEEKDVQLKEIHHRVKNNLQIVNTLLKMQGTYVQNMELQEVLGDCQGRVRAMALVHEHIYRVGDLNRVNVKAHLIALADGILRQFGAQDRVKIDLNVNYDHANLDNLIPLSLLMNELITNSSKHAFTGRDQGRITIVLRRLGDNQCELVYSDDGVGLRQEQFFHTDSFGLELVRTLASQLDGRIRLLKGEGTTFQMTFEPQARPMRRAS